MLTVSNKAVSFLKATKLTMGAPPDAGVRIQREAISEDRSVPAVSLAIRENPAPSDQSFEQDGLRIFVEDSLMEPLDGHTLDIREDDDGAAIILR
jgi:Fe-S cluster assembly iron-binding protein IscA